MEIAFCMGKLKYAEVTVQTQDKNAEKADTNFFIQPTFHFLV